MPGAAATLFLDFNGHIQTETVGDVQIPVLGYEVGGWSHFILPAFNRDGDPLTFSSQEQEEIRYIWASVAEDYAPFNINVTTIDPDPGNYHPESPYLRVVISARSDIRSGKNDGGFGEIGAYANKNDPNVAFVFMENKDIPAGQDGHLRDQRFLAEAASHEAGHTFGLEHYDNNTGDKNKAPIMESHGAIDARRGTWAQRSGSYYGGAQDDMAEIAGSANGFGYRADEHADGTSGATQLTATSGGLFGYGVIGNTSDVDTFRFVAGGDEISIWVEEASTPKSYRVGNLDAVLRILDANGALIAEVNEASTVWANWNGTLAAGTYYVQVASNGEYGDVGQYTVKAFDNTGARVVSSEYKSLSDSLGGMQITFNKPIDPNSFTISDVRINGGLAGAGVLSIGPPTNDSRTFLVTFVKPTTTVTSKWNISIGPQIADFFGNDMDQNENGENGESSDYYFASFLGDSAGTYDWGTTKPTTEVRGEISSLSADAYFMTYR